MMLPRTFTDKNEEKPIYARMAEENFERINVEIRVKPLTEPN